ncbi:hypothetical protein [Salipiger sp.]|uniref:hypothetical protein n=1 Tax=Salipiger sp. TaxID=2078585 RepID=UPI003A9768A4
MADDVARPRMALWLRLVLFASLALNLAVAGVVVGGVLRGHDGFHPPPRGRDFVTPYTRAFTDEERRELGGRLRAAYERDRPERDRPDRDGFVGGYRRGLDVLKTTPFSAEAFAETLSDQSAEAERRQQMGQTVLTDYLAAMSDEDRAAYAARLEVQFEELSKRFKRFREDRDHK